MQEIHTRANMVRNKKTHTESRKTKLYNKNEIQKSKYKWQKVTVFVVLEIHVVPPQRRVRPVPARRWFSPMPRVMSSWMPSLCGGQHPVDGSSVGYDTIFESIRDNYIGQREESEIGCSVLEARKRKTKKTKKIH